MNILVLSWRDSKHPLAGGAEQVMHEHMKGWVKVGHTVVHFSSYFRGGSLGELLDGINFIRRGRQFLGVQIAAFFWYLFGKHIRFDLVVDEFHGWPFFTPLYIKLPKLAVIQELTREVWFSYPLPFGLNFLFGTIGYLMEPLFFLPYRNVHFMTGSESAKNELLTVGIKEESITVVPHGVIIANSEKRIAKSKIKTILFLGALAKDKGIEDAIKTFGILRTLGDYQFWVVGKSDRKYLKSLKAMVERNKVSVKFFGYVSHREKFALLSKAHLLINPSIREGWGLVNIEANVVGTPVVAYNSPGLIDSVKNGITGVICDENTPDSMAGEVTALLRDTQRYEKMRKNAIVWAKGFSWKKSMRESQMLVDRVGVKKV
ncbi:MAG: Glycosyltransferase, family 4 [Candidatus Woesebacteria bacterium GW2011_GWB1_41_10]|uniref:Glycosyltransferase, family 4 n=1 Tax=Candidatus Woesebacteria bacterium GW2011_GWB1_41_10 TaxID=1618577 RepID=A0A0G0UKZ6_9BACT|nr:MAG: Glycosyltransferase, family 4 [Candidatus Woesebacteria bacterium GW2011_GWB1_41_10]